MDYICIRSLLPTRASSCKHVDRSGDEQHAQPDDLAPPPTADHHPPQAWLVDYDAHEAELALKLGLLCSHPLPAARPGMRQVMQHLDGGLPLPEFSADYLAISDVDQVLDLETSPSVATTITGLSGGR